MSGRCLHVAQYATHIFIAFFFCGGRRLRRPDVAATAHSAAALMKVAEAVEAALV
jgi:hypothetical protein